MNFELKSEMLHRGKYLAKRIENLGHGGYLPVEVPAVDIYGKGKRLGLRGINLHVDSPARELEHGSVEPEVLCSPQKLQEVWNGKLELVEEANLQLLEAWGGDTTNNRFRISVNSLQCKRAKVGKRDVCRDGSAHELPLHIVAESSEVKEDPEDLQLGH